MLKKYKITYRLAIKLYTWELEAPSKYAAKQIFYRKFPRGQIVSIYSGGGI
ncbi:MAG: hypothetical protein IJ303_04305 [Clostridia bacterium]|nr:hypothetical protein [Clostridia bacterium]